jgi:hypothetical protein
MFVAKVLSLVSALSVAAAYPAIPHETTSHDVAGSHGAAISHEARAVLKSYTSACDTSMDNITAILPSDINTRGGRPLLAPIYPAPTFTAISIGVQNYTCTPEGTWT